MAKHWLTADMNKVYGFEGECKAKHGEMTYKLFADVFTALPLATLLSASQPPSNPKSEGSLPAILGPNGEKRYFVVHGGPPVSKDGVTLNEIAKIDRYGNQPGQEGLMCEVGVDSSVKPILTFSCCGPTHRRSKVVDRPSV